MHSSRGFPVLSCLIAAVGVTVFIGTSASAQITGTYTYDPNYFIYFVTGDTTIDGDITGSGGVVPGTNVFVGKNNVDDFATVANDITLTVLPGAVTTHRPFRYPLGDPNAPEYVGLGAFGNNTINVMGGVVNTLSGYEHGIINVMGGEIGGSWAHAHSIVNITAGNSQVARNNQSGVLNISGGTVGYTSSENQGTTNISGGTVKTDVYCSNFTTLNFSGGTAGIVHGYDNSLVNITGGSLGSALGLGSSVTNISGGTVKYIYDFVDTPTTNISGGNIGGIDNIPNPTGIYDPNDTGIYLKSGTLNLFGSNFSITGTTAGLYAQTSGTYSTLTGTLLDGTALNTTLFLADGVNYEDRGGGTPDHPILPDTNGDGIFTFQGVATNGWFDPSGANAYRFTMTDGKRFTSILDFPTGIGDADGKYTVSVGNTILGVFGPGQSINFAEFGFAGGVTSFTISGIEPAVDAGNPLAFPIRLGFSSPFASFTMAGITSTAPEPASLALVTLLLPVIVGWWRSRRG